VLGESEKQIMQAAEGVAKPARKCCAAARSSRELRHTIFQGMEEEGLKLLQKAKQVTGLAIVTEVMSDRDVDLVAKYGCDAGGRPEHAEFHAAEKSLENAGAGVVETRIEQHGEGAADVRGIYYGARKSRCDFVRAGNSDV